MEEMDLIDFNFSDLDEFEFSSFESNGYHTVNEPLSPIVGAVTPISHLNSDSSCSETSEESEPDHIARKRKADELELQQQQYKLSRPHIVKSDIRRSFTNIWANVFNSQSYSVMMNHIRDFWDGNISFMERDLRLIKPYGGRSTKGPGFGHGYLAEFWYKAMNIAPDQVCTLKHTHLKTRSNGSATIKCCFGLNGTKVSTPIVAVDKDSITQLENVNCATAAGERGNASAVVTNSALFRAWSELSSTSTHIEEHEDTDSSDVGSDCTSAHHKHTQDALQDALTRYLTLSQAANKPSKRKRSRRAHVDLSVVAAEQWLAPPQDVVIKVKEEPVCPTHNVRIKDNKVYVAGTTDNSLSWSLRLDNDRANNVVYQYGLQQGDNGEVVLTSRLDSLYSFEMDFNADGRIIAMILNYIS